MISRRLFQRIPRAREVLRLRRLRLELAYAIAKPGDVAGAALALLRSRQISGATNAPAKLLQLHLVPFLLLASARLRLSVGRVHRAFDRGRATAPSNLSVRARGVELATNHAQLVRRLGEVDLHATKLGRVHQKRLARFCALGGAVRRRVASGRGRVANGRGRVITVHRRRLSRLFDRALVVVGGVGTRRRRRPRRLGLGFVIRVVRVDSSGGERVDDVSDDVSGSLRRRAHRDERPSHQHDDHLGDVTRGAFQSFRVEVDFPLDGGGDGGDGGDETEGGDDGGGGESREVRERGRRDDADDGEKGSRRKRWVFVVPIVVVAAATAAGLRG